MSKRTVIWEAIFPSVFILLMLVAGTLIFGIASGFFVSLFGVTSGVVVLWQECSQLLPVLLAYLLTLFGLRKMFQYDEARFGVDTKKVPIAEAIPMICIIFAVAGLSSVAMDSIGITRLFSSYEEGAEVIFRGQNVFLLIITTVIAGPIAEEVVFRGITYRRLKEILGERKAIVLSAVLFGIYHMNVVQFLFSIIVGIFFAWSYERSKTLLVPIAAHMINNLYAAIFNMNIEYIRSKPEILKYIMIIQIIMLITAVIFMVFRSKKAVKI